MPAELNSADAMRERFRADDASARAAYFQHRLSLHIRSLLTAAWTAGFLGGVGRKPWDDMADYAALCGMEYAERTGAAGLADALKAGWPGTEAKPE